MKNLLFITTSSLAANPRLVKEFETLKHGYVCFVLCFKHQDWSLTLSEEIKLKNPEVHFIEIDRHVHVFQTLLFKIIHKISIAFNGLFSKNLTVSAFASNDKAPQLWFHTKSLVKNYHFNRVIAHNLGAFYPALRLSERNNLQLQLDIEDYYPGEAVYFNKNWEEQNRMQLMAQSFLKADYITYASEGIFLECEKHFEVKSKAEKMVLINAFNAADFKMPKNQFSEPIKCVWFSQRIGPNRGLDNIFKAAENLKDVEFHLIGNANQEYLDSQIIGANIKLHKSMKQDKLHEFLSQMDIGLALENAEADPNRNICLTNKILAYFQAGCYVVATDTFGQRHFMNTLKYEAGEIITSTLEETLLKLDRNILDINLKVDRWQNAKLFCWENEKFKLRSLFQGVQKLETNETQSSI